MKISLEISDKLFKNDANNNFQEFFDRVIADICMGISSEGMSHLCGRYELETATLLKHAFKQARYED